MLTQALARALDHSRWAAPPAHVPARPVPWRSPDQRYRLEELTHPWHLIMEGYHLGHCIADNVLPSSAGTKDLTSLTYWRKIDSGASRIFSLAERHRPLCTLHIETSGPTLAEAEPKRPALITGGEDYYPALVDAVRHLNTQLGPLRFKEQPRVYNQPPPPPSADIAAWLAWFLAQRLRRRRFPDTAPCLRRFPQPFSRS